MGLRDFFRPTTEHSDPAVRTGAVAALTDKTKLLEIVICDRDDSVAEAAIDRIAALSRADGDLQLLSRIASTDEHSPRGRHAAAILRSWQIEAVSGVRDAATLARIATTAEDQDVRASAVARITDESELASIARKTGDAGILARIREPRLIHDLAVNASGSVQDAAIARLDDQRALEQIAGDRKQHSSVRRSAIERLRDEEALARLVLEKAPEAHIAIAQIHDSRLLARLAMEAPLADSRCAAIKRIHDVGTLLKIALEDNVSLVWDEALCRLRDVGAKEAIARVAQMAEPERRKRAVYCLTDSSLLFEIATSEPDAVIRTLAAERITDSNLLRRLAESDRAEGAAARKRLESSHFLVEDALRGRSVEIRLAAIEKLRDLDPLDQIIETAREPALREAASRRRAAVKPWLDAQADLQRRIDLVKASSDYRLELEIKAKEDHEGYVTPTYDHLTNLEFELRQLIEAGPTATI